MTALTILNVICAALSVLSAFYNISFVRRQAAAAEQQLDLSRQQLELSRKELDYSREELRQSKKQVVAADKTPRDLDKDLQRIASSIDDLTSVLKHSKALK